MNNDPEEGSGLSLWDRFSREPEYLVARKDIRKRYNLPLPYDIRWNFRKWRNWLGLEDQSQSRKRKRGEAFLSEVHALLKKYQIPESWYPDFIADIAGISGGPVAEVELPRFDFYQSADGEWKWECIVTPETDLTDPFILTLILTQQKEYAGAPPKPAKTQTDHRKLDWHPVYEWHKHHPLFSIAEIAEMIGFAPETLRRKFRELRKEGL